MSEVRFVVREAERDWSGTIHGSMADRAMAALSADPVTLEELEAAVTRFANPDARGRFFSNLRNGLRDDPYDAGLVVIDLVARLIVVDSTYSCPARDGTVEYHNGKCCTDTNLRYHLADDWLFCSDGNEWQHVAKSRRRELAAKPIPDYRSIFYGQAMLEFLAREIFAAFARRGEIAAAVRAQWTDQARKRLADQAKIAPEQVDTGQLTEEAITPKTWSGEERYASPFYETVKKIHADWLLTAREDLGGACPREIALSRTDHLSWDMEDRCQQWSLFDACPRGLDTSSHAFKYGGFGTHELVMYYQLVRELLWSCWENLTEQMKAPRAGMHSESFTAGDFLATEIPRLEVVREAWLDGPSRVGHGRTPRSVIERERARLPEGMSGREAMHDPDCPCCQMIADMPGPTFWHLDGSGMEDEFVFNIHCRTRDEWDKEQSEYEEFSRRSDAERAERERLGVTDVGSNPDGSHPIWSRSFYVNDGAEAPLGIRVFGVGCHLAELIARLRSRADGESTPPAAQFHIDELNRDFGNLRGLLLSSDAALAQALIDPVLDRFAETLVAVAADRPELAPQCESLSNELRKLLDPPSQEPTWNSGDFDVPF